MPIKIMTVEETNLRYKQARQSSVTGMPEYEDLQMKLSAGLRPNESVVIEMPQSATLMQRASFKRCVRKRVKRLALPYSVRAMYDGNSGRHICIVANEVRVDY
jgi:hypothetical protein